MNYPELKKKLLCHINCAEDLQENYIEIGETIVIESRIGNYRETNPKSLSRFGYRFEIEHVGKPHLMVIKYPDDKRRMLCINDGTSYDLSTGIFSGGNNEITGKMQTICNVFYPRWKDESVLFSTWGYGEPAAVSEFWVYEVEKLPNLELYETGRTFGIQYEDPCNINSAEGAYTFVQWLERHIEYMNYSGQNRLVYPINWYHGPIIPVKCQPADKFAIYTGKNRKRYVRSTLAPPDWLEDLLSRFDDENLLFTGSMTLMRLGHLLKNMNTDIENIYDGADTYNNMLYNNCVQSSCNDWTAEYNCMIYPDMIEDKFNRPKIFAYGEKKTSDQLVPMFNPIHPTVREQLLEYFEEICQKYSHHKSFEGIAVNFWHGTLLWFGNIRAGYDDYTIELFAKETGIIIDTDKRDKQRFSKRYTYIISNCRDSFIDWRCRKIHEFICQIRDVVISYRSDMMLTLTIWNEPSMRGYLGTIDASSQYGARISNYDLYKEGGLDLALFKNEMNVEISIERSFMRDRGLGKKGICADLKYKHFFEDFAFLDEETHIVMKSLPNTSAFMFNCWVEAWGKFSRYMPDENDQELEIARKTDFNADFVFIENSEYKDDTDRKFWHDSQLRITAAFPSAPYFMEWMINDLVFHDSLSFTSGGLYLDKAHAMEQRKFAENFRRLPKIKFNTFNAICDPVIVRWLCYNNKTYIYVINREPYEIQVNVVLENNYYNKILSPFELDVEIYNGIDVPQNINTVISDEIRENYHKKMLKVLSVFEKASKKNICIPGSEGLIARMIDAEHCGRYSELRHILSSYIVDKTSNIIKYK